MESQQIDTFIEQLVTDKKLTGLTTDARQQVINELKAELLNQIDRAIINALPDDKIDELEKIIDDPNTTQSDIDQLVASANINAAAVTAETIIRFRTLYLGEDKKG